MYVHMYIKLNKLNNGGWGVDCVHTFFQTAISPWKRGLEVQKFLTFPITLSIFRKSKTFFWFFSVVLGYLEEAGTINPLLKLHPEDV